MDLEEVPLEGAAVSSPRETPLSSRSLVGVFAAALEDEFIHEKKPISLSDRGPAKTTNVKPTLSANSPLVTCSTSSVDQFIVEGEPKPLPASPDLIGATFPCSVEEALTIVTKHSEEWAEKPLQDKAVLADQCLRLLKRHASDYLAASYKRRGIKTPTPADRMAYPLCSTVGTALFLTTLKSHLTRMGKKSDFPKEYTTEPLSDGRIRVKFDPEPGLFAGIVNAGTTFELIVNANCQDKVEDEIEITDLIWNALSGQDIYSLINKNKYSQNNCLKTRNSSVGKDSSDRMNSSDQVTSNDQVVLNDQVPSSDRLNSSDHHISEEEGVTVSQEDGKPRRQKKKKGFGWSSFLKKNSSCSCSQEQQQQQNSLQFKLKPFLENSRGVAAVLGAGNHEAPVDLLTPLFCENMVVVYKASPLMEDMLPVLFKVLEPLLKGGYLRIVRGGAEEGQRLISDERVAKWWMTGSSTTARKILFGDEDLPKVLSSKENMSRALRIKKPFVTELGNASPWIICPSPEWSKKEVLTYARHLAFHSLFNGGHICAHPQVIITCRNWPQRTEFLNAFREAITMNRFSQLHWYPGSDTRFEQIEKRLAEEGVDVTKAKILPNVIFVEDARPDSCLVREESFCCAFCEVSLDTCPAVVDFLPRAVDFANSGCEGCLSAVVIVKPDHQKESNEAIEAALLKLNYGTVGLNMQTTNCFVLPQCIWGGHPSTNEPPSNLLSGVGFFNNLWGFRHPMKCILRTMFCPPNIAIQMIPETESDAERLAVMNERLVKAFAHKGHGATGAFWDVVGVASAAFLGF